MTASFRGVVCLAALATICTAPSVRAQYQSCALCDVDAFLPDPLPDPLPVNPCMSGTGLIRGVGFADTLVNYCDVTPTVAVRSTRPDRLTIVSFQVLDDGRIQFDYDVSCTPNLGLVGIDVTIDDDPTDSAAAYACGNARMVVERIDLSVTWDSLRAVTAGAAGNDVSWSTGAEVATLGFRVVARHGDGSEVTLPELVPARGAGASYLLEDRRPNAAATVAYRVVEVTGAGRDGDVSEWFGVVRPATTGRGR